MAIYKFADYENMNVGFTIHVPGKLLVYIRWESDDPHKFEFNDYYEIDFSTPENSYSQETWEEMEEEVRAKTTPYGKFVRPQKGDESQMIEGIIKSKEEIIKQPNQIKYLFVKGIL